jgi:hypothetical protein
MPDGDLSGGLVIAIAPQTLRWATDQMVETLGAETLKKLKVRAGEHLAAMLTTTFLLTPPTGIDAEGGADLWFDLSRRSGDWKKPVPILPDGTASAAFEIKSMPGPYREYDSSIDRDQARGVDATGRSLKTRVKAANDVLREAGPVLLRARDQLHRKTSAKTSRNIFLVMHLFDHSSPSACSPSSGRYLIHCPISIMSTQCGCSGHWSISPYGRTSSVNGLTCSSTQEIPKRRRHRMRWTPFRMPKTTTWTVLATQGGRPICSRSRPKRVRRSRGGNSRHHWEHFDDQHVLMLWLPYPHTEEAL